MPICIFAEPEDLVPNFVGFRARERGLEVLWLSESKLGENWSFRFDDRYPSRGYLIHKDTRYRFGELSGAYVNLNPQPPLPFGIELESRDMDTFLGARRYSIRHLIATLPVPVANRLHAGCSNNSKPYQMRALARCGFTVPDWIVSNAATDIERFVEFHDGAVVCKSISGLRSRVRMFDGSMRDRLAAGTTPIIAQQHIGGRDVRVHTVNGMAFATEIRTSAGVDYRFDESEQQYTAIPLAGDIEALCHRFAAREEMLIAGFDFRVTNDDEWYCLEMNPVPTFMPYELATGQPIAYALLDVIGDVAHAGEGQVSV